MLPVIISILLRNLKLVVELGKQFNLKSDNNAMYFSKAVTVRIRCLLYYKLGLSAGRLISCKISLFEGLKTVIPRAGPESFIL